MSVGHDIRVSWESFSFFCCPTPTGFYSQKLWGFIFLVLEPGVGWSGLGLGSLAPEVPLPVFIHHMWTWGHAFHISTPLHSFSISLPLVLAWVNVTSLNPWLSDFHTAWFSDDSQWYLFCSCNFCCSCARRWGMFTYASIWLSLWCFICVPAYFENFTNIGTYTITRHLFFILNSKFIWVKNTITCQAYT